MIKRLPKRLQPQRQYLTYVVGLLVATFVLTAVLAYQAHHSIRGLKRQTDAQATHVALQAVQDWSIATQTRAGGELQSIAAALGAQAVTGPEQAWSILRARLVTTDGICSTCATREQVAGWFAINRAGEIALRGAEAPKAMLHSVWKEIGAGNTALFNPTWGGALFFQARGGVPYVVAAFGQFDDTEKLEAVYGFVMPPQVAREILQLAFSSISPPQLTGESSVGLNRIFAIQAEVQGTRLFADEPVAHIAGELPTEVIHGVQLKVGVRREALGLVVAQPPRDSVVILLALLVVIAALIFLAVVLVSREAELVRLRADFISSVSHELRTPLAQIRMFTETLLLGRVRSDLDRRRSLEIIDQEARRLSNLIENVLLYSKSEGGRAPRLRTEPTTFGIEVRQAVESFGPLCRLKDVEIRAELEDSIAAEVDRGALRQILVNLLDNALKYGPRAQRITVGMALFENRARLWVDDEGPGVPLADRDRVFDSFVRLKRDVETHTGGSGIGLAVVRELTRLHGGNAWVEAAPGGGARFLIEFPDAYLHAEQSAADLAAAS